MFLKPGSRCGQELIFLSPLCVLHLELLFFQLEVSFLLVDFKILLRQYELEVCHTLIGLLQLLLSLIQGDASSSSSLIVASDMLLKHEDHKSSLHNK